jgi:formate dehydrogenase major subunit
VIIIASRRGQVSLHVHRDDGTPSGSVFVLFAHFKAAANLMTNAAMDPFGKIPEFEYCAVPINAGGPLPANSRFGVNN